MERVMKRQREQKKKKCVIKREGMIDENVKCIENNQIKLKITARI